MQDSPIGMFKRHHWERGVSEVYAYSFLPLMQMMARQAIGELKEGSQGIASLRSPGCRNSLAKLLDEYSFATFTLPA